MPLETRRPVDTTAPRTGTRDTAPCAQCGESVEPGERGPVPTYCPDCRELRHTVNRLQRILDRRPELREVMERELCVKLSKAPRPPGQPRSDTRNRRHDLYFDHPLWWWMVVLADERGLTCSAVACGGVRVLREGVRAGHELRVEDGEVMGWKAWAFEEVA